MMSRHEFRFGCLELLDTYAVITCNDGENIDYNEVEEVKAVLGTTFKGKNFGLIANRVSTYSVNPIAIKRLFSVHNLVAGAIVGDSTLTKINAEFEAKIISEKPIKYHGDMSSAVMWIEGMIRDGVQTL